MHGVVLGKFLPPHNGHLYLVDFARRYCEELTVVVGSLAREPIAGELRWLWMQELVPGARVVHLNDENPQQPDEHPDFWNIWKASLERVVDRPIDLLFASEDYGQPLAQALGAQFIPVNGYRQVIDISGTALRQQPLRHWEHLPPVVRPYFVQRISIFGPESTGKSTLTQRLAAHFDTLWVPEYARTWLELRGGEVRLEDMVIISKGQRASEEALARQANRRLFCDTDPSATLLWSQELFATCAPELSQQKGNYDLTLLCDVDVPWVADSVRYRPQGRSEFWQRCQQLLESEGRHIVCLSGSWEERWKQALEAVSGLG
jgi:NadR type nicotinamide-nucleotide adenylyltransferase